MLQLETFGGLTLSAPGGTPAPTTRLRLALLALLASAGSRGLTRDKMLAYLWPESTPENARHALEQLLYALRRQLPPDIVTGGDPLRLNPAVVTSDVGQFEQRLAAGDLEGATALYRGPFLDGVFLTDSPEFEAWVEAERTRLARDCQTALYELAKQAGARGNATAEIACWRRLTAADPLSERAAAGLVRALAGAGDWSAATEHARAY
ncbi:MAG TPA: BTAD domain-containing putative transcriptional regulator, partial [Gemmatimonadales bacterium]|nr:BTAD domain-containing putative transcriptional regulator [Gemmatimonadales bacterium]